MLKRKSRLHRGGRGFDPCLAHHSNQASCARCIVLANPHDQAVTIPIRLRDSNNNTSAIIYTGFDGWYYFYGVPSGLYVLEVLARKPNGDWLIIVKSRQFRVTQDRFTRVPDVEVR